MSWVGNIGIARFGIVVACALNVALMPKPAPAHMAVDASGMFINEQGGILTAEHAVAPCASVYVVYAGQVSRAELVARDGEQDLALLRSALVPFLPAVFAREPSSHARMVFVDSFAALNHDSRGMDTLFNASLSFPDGMPTLLSRLAPGASGAPVMSQDGRVLGMVVANVGAGPGAAGRYALSRGYRTPAVSQATRTRAVSVNAIRAFLGAAGEPFFDSDMPQLGPGQMPSGRAATVSVGVICDRRK